MPRKNVNGFVGEAVYGAAGDYRYEHADGTEVHVYQDPEDRNRWGVMVNIGTIRDPDLRNVGDMLTKDRAFERAYNWMKKYDSTKTKKYHDTVDFAYGEFGGFE